MIPLNSADYLSRKLQKLDTELPSEAKRVLENADDEAVHDLRVTIRRLRTILKLARPVFGKFHADAVRAAFAEAQKATGDLRDEEALEETLEALEEGGRAITEWVSARKPQRTALHESVTRVIDTGELKSARHMLGALLTLPAEPNKSFDLERFSRKCVEDARKTVDTHRDVPTTDVEGLHELRIAYKGLRYTIETFADVLPVDLRALREPAVRLQKLLGDVHDIDMALGVIQAASELHHATRHALLNSLVEKRAKKIEAFEQEMRPKVPADPTPASTTP
ncbi:MAG: CHAD domain-containing protein [Polyangiaceae bacterium]